MAKFLILDKKHYDGSKGMIPLKRGDDWLLSGKIVEKYASYQADLDLSGASATAYFAGTGTDVTASVTLEDAPGGAISVSLGKEATPGVALAEEGTSLYLVVTGGDGKVFTVETPDEALEIKDRGFESF